MFEEILVSLNDNVFKYIMIRNKEYRNYLLSNILKDIKIKELNKAKIENIELIIFNKRDNKNI